MIKLSAELGALCSRVQLCDLDVAGLLTALCAVFEADGALLGLRGPGRARHHVVGLDEPRALRLCAGAAEPPALTQLAGTRAVCRLSDLGEGAGDPSLLDDLETSLVERLGLGSILRVAAGDGVLLLGRFTSGLDFEQDAVLLLDGLLGPLGSACVTLAQGIDEESAAVPALEVPSEVDLGAAHAWERCSVPLVLLDSSVRVLSANPAARRKLDMAGATETLPAWMDEVVRARLVELTDQGGLPDNVSGDYQFVGPSQGRRLLRLGLVPVESPGDRWVLSVEHGGPSLTDRLNGFASHHGLTDKERETIELLADGLTNQRMSELLNIREPSVKARMSGIMEKTNTDSRTDLLAALFGFAGAKGG